MCRAASRPSAIAHTTSDCPRRQSPAANTPGTEVAYLPSARIAPDSVSASPRRAAEGAAVIKSENGQLLNDMTLNVRGRDAVGFVEEAKPRGH